MNFYSPADESRILAAYQLKGKARKQELERIAKALGRSYRSISQKGVKLNRDSKSKNGTKVRTSKTSPAREAKVSGSTIRFPYRSIEIDTATQEIVVKV